ncbi:MAG: ferredoxin family protein [Synergistaceae bacterium]|jgi:adenylylsulfate reductase subunit B|nr:ferredoxin family protein [Synergistaceae bacterium]
MSIEIRREACIGCGQCADVCPGSLILIGPEGHAVIPRPERCWGCASCVKECPALAIEFFLGEDMGGKGGRMTVRRDNSLLRWDIVKPDGSLKTITIDSRDPNGY